MKQEQPSLSDSLASSMKVTFTNYLSSMPPMTVQYNEERPENEWKTAKQFSELLHSIKQDDLYFPECAGVKPGFRIMRDDVRCCTKPLPTQRDCQLQQDC